MSNIYRFYPINRFAPEAGIELGMLLSENVPDWKDMIVDLTHVKTEILISSFTISFMQYCDQNNLLDRVNQIEWQAEFPFQVQAIKKLINEFKPSHSRLGPYQRQFKVDEHVRFDVGSVKGSGIVLGCSVRGILDFYIILLDKLIPGYTDKAVVVPSTTMSEFDVH